MAAPMSEITLGFVERTENWRLSRRIFPSKVGGRPAWLSMNDIPNSEKLKCRACGAVCVFLMQVYCPIAEQDTCFHRTLFIFCCRDQSCHKHSDNAAFVVFRSQLPRENEFYDYEPPKGDIPPEEGKCYEDGLLCAVCGCFGGKKCAKCHMTSYCCREHQLVDWKAGHKKECGSTGLSTSGSEQILFPEFELVTESEDYSLPDKTGGAEEKCSVHEDAGDRGALNMAELERMALSENKEDRQFARFKKRTDHEPEQVIRYERGGQPLLISHENQPQLQDIPPCSSCGSERLFEFQVMPQLLIHLDVDSLGASMDWGTLLIYTCAKSCDGPSAYRPEFLWKQDIAPEPHK